VVRAYIGHGDAPTRLRRRLKYVLVPAWAATNSLKEVEKEDGAPVRARRGIALSRGDGLHHAMSACIPRAARPQLSRICAAGRAALTAEPIRGPRRDSERSAAAPCGLRCAEPSDRRCSRDKDFGVSAYAARAASARRRGELESGAAWSPATATPAASSPPHTGPCAHASPTSWRRGSRLDLRIHHPCSPAAHHPAPFTMSRQRLLLAGRSRRGKTRRGHHVLTAAAAPRPPSMADGARVARDVPFDALPAADRDARRVVRGQRSGPTETFSSTSAAQRVARARGIIVRPPAPMRFA